MAVRILLAEDNDSLALPLAKFLTGHGYQVRRVADGVAAMQALAGGDVDLLVLDLRLPQLAGIDVLQKMRKAPATARLPVVVITGVYKGEQYVTAAQRLGVSQYLEKPFKPDVFLKAVKTALAEASGLVAAPATAAPAPAQATTATAAPAAPKSMLDQLVALHSGRKTGQLLFGDGSPISFLQGNPISFTTTGRNDFLAFLVSRGRLSAEDARFVASQRSDRLFLTRTGLLAYDDLQEESRLFLVKRLAELTEQPAGGSFTEQALVAEFPLVPLSLPRLLYDGLRSRSQRPSGQEFLSRYGGRYPARTQQFYLHANLLTMRSEDIQLLARIDGQTPLQAAAQGLKADDVALACHYLLAFGMLSLQATAGKEAEAPFPVRSFFNRPLEEAAPVEERAVDFGDLVSAVTDAVELTPEGMDAPLSSAEIGLEQAILREQAQLKDKNYYEIFGLSQQSFSFNTLKEAYFAKSREFSPEKFMALPGNVQSAAEEILAAYANAYNTLSNVVAKERYDELLNANTVGLAGKKDDRLQAQVQFQSGKVFLEMEEYDNAEKALQDAYTLESDNGRHCAYLAWAIYRNPHNKTSKAALEKARNLLAKSLQLEKTAEAYAFRGWMLLDEGRDSLAEAEFQKALRLSAQERVARQGMRLIEEKREAEKKGLFRRFFT